MAIARRPPNSPPWGPRPPSVGARGRRREAHAPKGFIHPPFFLWVRFSGRLRASLMIGAG